MTDTDTLLFPLLVGLPERLKATRKARGVTQQEAARAMNIGHSMLCHFERRQVQPVFGTLIRIAWWIDTGEDVPPDVFPPRRNPIARCPEHPVFPLPCEVCLNA